MFSDLLDDVLDFYVDYSLRDARYRVLCRVSSKVRSIDFPVYEACDVLTCVHAEQVGGKKLTSDEWKSLLRDSGKDVNFWESALDHFVMLTVAIASAVPAKA